MTLGAFIGNLVPPLSPEWWRADIVSTPYGADVALGPNAGEPHYAVDFGTPQGTPLYSMGTGRVLQPNENPEGVTGGGTVTIDYGNGLIVTFAHLSEIMVTPGQSVSPYQMIGKTGGEKGTPGAGLSTGPHLHIDAWLDGEKIDVRDLFDPLGTKGNVDPAKYQRAADAGGFRLPFISDVGDWAGAVVGFLTAVLNPANWARILAIFGGAILTLIGAWWVWSAS